MGRKDEPATPGRGNFKNPTPHPQKGRRGVAAPLPHLEGVRQHRLRRNLAIIVPPLVLLTIVTGYLALPVSKVSTVRVRGNTNVSASTVQRASGLTNSSLIPAVWLNGQHVGQRVVKHVARVASAKAQVTGARDVTITVTEHETVGYVQRGDSYHALLDDGTIIRTGTSAPKSGDLIFKGFGNGLQRVVRVVAKFPTSIRHDIFEVQSTRGGGNPYQITITMSDGNTIVADSRTVGKKIKYYPTIIKQVNKTGTVDLEVGAFFTPKSTK